MSDLSSDENDPLSFFQIGGIHGLPPTSWNYSGSEGPVSGKRVGYCAHGMVIFPTWHRPYICLFEVRLFTPPLKPLPGHVTIMQQALQQKALKIVGEDPCYDSNQWQEAAKTLRAPYWDWALKEGGGVPPEEVITRRDITVHTPHGPMTMKNPLLSYTFHPEVDQSFRRPFLHWNETLRHPKPECCPRANTNVDELTKYRKFQFLVLMKYIQ